MFSLSNYFERVIFGKYLLWTVNIIFVSILIYTFYASPKVEIYQCIIAFLLIAPFLLIFKIKTALSNNILFLSLYTYFTIPFAINLFICGYFKISIFNCLLSIFFTTLLIFTIKYFVHKKNNRKLFLDHSKISLDILRFFFLVIVTLSAVYGKLLNDFSAFTDLMPIFKAIQKDELRSYFQLTFQVIAVPFIFSTTLLRIAVDWLLLKK